MSGKKTARPSGQVHGVLLVDKPSGMTSFDVVAQARRVFGTRRVGHAGTLDPMATGVLVILLGEATKLSNILTTDKKAYVTKIALGATTNTLDLDGQITRRVPLTVPLTQERLEKALELERARRDQIPPQVSAIKVDGKRAYDQARKGVELDLAPRPVRVHELQLLGFTSEFIELSLTVSKGYYVRSLGRDLADSLGTVGHLVSLRRTQSGPFLEHETHPLPLTRQLPLLSLEQAAALCLPILRLTEQGALHVQQGKRLRQDDIVSTQAAEWPHAMASVNTYAAFLGETMIALVEPAGDQEYRVRRGLSNTPAGRDESERDESEHDGSVELA